MSALAVATHRELVLPWQARYEDLFGAASTVTRGGAKLTIVDHGPEAMRVLRNLGESPDSPILARYDWPGRQKPFMTQQATSALLIESPRAYVLSEMGTGKTRAMLYAGDFLVREGYARRILVAAPLSTLRQVWAQEIKLNFPMLNAVVAHGDRATRAERIAFDGAQVVIINHHGVPLMWAELVKGGFDVVILDESTYYRNAGTGLWKGAKQVVAKAKWAWGASGSPMPRGPMDVYGQAALLTPHTVPSSKSRWRAMTMVPVSPLRWLPKPGHVEMCHDALRPSVRFTRDEVMELPPVTHVTREVAPTVAQADFLKQLSAHYRAEMADGRSITAANAGVMWNKLLQAAAGYVYGNDETVHEIPNKARLDAVQDIVDETDRKVIVFTPWVHAAIAVHKHLVGKGTRAALIHGGIGQTARNKVFTEFQGSAEGLRVIVAHPGTMAHGLTLTRANTVVWYSPTSNLELYEQGNGRITRPGQDSKQLIVHLQSARVEALTYTRLRERKTTQDSLLSMLEL